MYSMRFLLDQWKRLGKVGPTPSRGTTGADACRNLAQATTLEPYTIDPMLSGELGIGPGARRDMHQARSVPASTSRLGGDTASVPHSPCPLWPLYYPDHSSQPPPVQLDFRYPD
jgi:hypothetical protein